MIGWAVCEKKCVRWWVRPRASCGQEESGSGWRREGPRGRVGHFEQRSRNNRVFVSSTTTFNRACYTSYSKYILHVKKNSKVSSLNPKHLMIHACSCPRKGLIPNTGKGTVFGIRNTLWRHISTLFSRLMTNNMEFLCFWRNKLNFYQNIVGGSKCSPVWAHWFCSPLEAASWQLHSPCDRGKAVWLANVPVNTLLYMQEW